MFFYRVAIITSFHLTNLTNERCYPVEKCCTFHYNRTVSSRNENLIFWRVNTKYKRGFVYCTSLSIASKPPTPQSVIYCLLLCTWPKGFYFHDNVVIYPRRSLSTSQTLLLSISGYLRWRRRRRRWRRRRRRRRRRWKVFLKLDN